jgi:hypothetical protein
LTTLHLRYHGGFSTQALRGGDEAARPPGDPPVHNVTSSLYVHVRPLVPLAVYGVLASSLTWVAIQWPIVVAAVVYAGLFLSLAWRWPQIALAMIFALAPFQNDLSGGGPVRFSIAEINLFLTLPVFLTRTIMLRRRIPIGPITLPVAFYFAVCLFSSVHSWRATSLVSLIQMFLYMVAATTVFSCFFNKPRDLVVPLYALVCVGSGVSLAMMIAPRLLNLNKNGVGASLACAVVVCAELWFVAKSVRRRAILVAAMLTITAGLIFSLSRGSWMAAITGLAVVAGLRRQFDLLLKMALLMLPGIAIFWSLLPAESREYATGFSKDRYNIQMRYESLESAGRLFHAHPMTGVGVGLRKEYDATNVIMLTLAETGAPGLATFLLIYVAVIILVVRTQRCFARDDPLYSLVALGGALALGRLAHGLVDHYWSRGAIMMAWASVGMTVAAYYTARLRRAEARNLVVVSPAAVAAV